MSWLNTIKGQLTNLAQEVLAETAGPGDEEYNAPDVETDETIQQVNHFEKLCAQQSKEIEELRKQIEELHNNRKEDASGLTSVQLEKPLERHGHAMEDSWSWELPDAPKADNDNFRVSEQFSNVKHNETVGGSSGEESSSEALNKKDIEAVLAEANKRIEQLENEKKESYRALEELDSEHNLSIQNILELKTELHEQLTMLKRDHDNLKEEKNNLFVKHEIEMAKTQKLLEELEKIYEKSEINQKALQKQYESTQAELKESRNEINNMQALLEKKDQDNKELVERVKLLSDETQKLAKEQVEVLTKLDEKTKLLDEAKRQINEMSSSGSSSGKLSEEDFIVVRDGDAHSSEPNTPPTKRELQDKIVQLENRVSELTLENGSLTLKLRNDDMEKEENLCKLRDNLNELQIKHAELQGKLELTKEENLTKSSLLDEEYPKKIELLENRLKNLQKDNDELNVELERLRLTNEHYNELQKKYQQLTLENQENELKVNTLPLEAMESKIKELSQENDSLRLELESKLFSKPEVTDLDEEEDIKMPIFSLEHMRELLKVYCDGVSLEDEKSVENIYASIQERLSKYAELEERIVHLTAELKNLQDSKQTWKHEKKTLEADISQYILQCDELMKNNEILLNELENYKCNKLQTIPEENIEENIFHLESQLEECTRLNKSFEMEYVELNDKINELEREKQILTEKLRAAQQECTALKNQQQNMANDENSTDNKLKDDHEILEKYDNLTSQHDSLSKDHAALVSTMQVKSAALEAAQTRCEVNEKQLFLQQQELEAKKVELEILKQSFEELKSKHGELLKELNAKNDEITLLRQTAEAERQSIAERENNVVQLGIERDGLIKTLEQKHNESMQYYAEIQRLLSVVQQLQQQIELEKNILKTCEKCSNAESTIAALKREQEKFQDQIVFLKEKSDILTTNLLTEQTNQRLVQQDNKTLQEQNSTLQKELIRLREHLLEVEEQQTQESIDMQRELNEYKSKIELLESEVSKSSTAYTSASIRANQQAETLQAQYTLLVQQRDELLTKLSLAEDREAQNQTAIFNLQNALEQFQNDKENDIKSATQRMRKELQMEEMKQKKLQEEIDQLSKQLYDANQGLKAAARLSDQLEECQKTILSLREELDIMKNKNTTLENKLTNSECNQADRIDKSLIKSLIIGYFASSNDNDKQQILRMITSILDFTQNETEKVGLNKQRMTWLGSILGQSQTDTDTQNSYAKENLVEAFVHFLEKESQPFSENMPNLLNVTQTSNDARAPRRPSVSENTPVPIPIQPLLMNSNEFAPSRNSSSILKDILNDT